MWTVDASVWICADSPSEPGSAPSRALLDHLISTRARIIVPTLLLVEVAGAFGRARRDPALAREFAARLNELPTIQWVPLDVPASQRAATLAADRGLRGADAVYAAVALAHGCQLVSLDREHTQRLAGIVPVRTPFDPAAETR